MNLRQWFSHLVNWLYLVRSFPLPIDSTHMWVGLTGDRRMTCLICGAAGEDRDISEEELQRDRDMNEAWEKMAKELFGEDDGEVDNRS